MVDAFSVATFEPRIGQHFTAELTTGQQISFELISAVALVDLTDDHSRDDRRRPFVLKFTGPDGVGLPQGTYSFKHDAFGKFDMFIVPIERVENRLIFEAVFN